MKFNEKLIELRKKAGLSQEELGQKLNVTRQTVSKWELGQTTPEMDKLSEMGKIFNVSVDELINESEPKQNQTEAQPKVIEDQHIAEEKPKKSREKIVAIVLVVLLVVAIVLVIGIATNKKTDNNQPNQVTEETSGFIEKFFKLFNKLFDEALDEQGENQKKMNIMSFNGPLQIYGGSASDLTAGALLDQIVTINKTKDRKVTVIYDGIETQDEKEIISIKQQLNGNYEVTFDYDVEGYIAKATIESVYTEMDVNAFNYSLKIYSGTNMGGGTTFLLDNIITSNKTKERKITVVYNGTETQDETEIKNIKKKIDMFSNYDITFEYDEIGFIYKATIEKM